MIVTPHKEVSANNHPQGRPTEISSCSPSCLQLLLLL